MKEVMIQREASFFRSNYLRIFGLLSLFMIAGAFPIMFISCAHQSSLPFIASIDTMKESRDTETRPLSLSEIKKIVNLSASLNTNYITVDTHWDYPSYMKEWIDAVRATGRHVWFRSHPNQWEDDNGTSGVMTPAQYESAERAFILAHPTFFQPGDIFDPCPEPEEGLYWQATYGATWTNNAPNAATRAYNAFLRDTSDVADAAFHQVGINNVITNVRSTNSFFPMHPNILEAATVNKFGYITIDSYPDENTTNPIVAARARVDELNQIENLWHVPIIIGEMGYSNAIDVDDAQQRTVLQAEFHALSSLNYLAGTNYWVGAGSASAGGYTNLFVKLNGEWTLRQAAYQLGTFYQTKLNGRA
jgi:hypothetical protein